MIAASASHSRRVVISALGVTQILAWGSSYYLPAVLAKPITVETGWPLGWVVAGLSCGLLAAGIVSPLSGGLIQKWGGRPIMAAGALLLAAGLILMALSHALPLYLLAWMVMGIGMACGLYDAAFATLGRLYGQDARSAITSLTLFGGFASTICWPLSAFLVEQYGWRGACLIYAGIQLLIALPLHLTLIPAQPRAIAPVHAAHMRARIATSERMQFILLAVILMLAAAIASALSVHLLSILQLRGTDLAGAVALGALIGPSQVGARVFEMMFGRHYHAIWTMLASVVLLAIGVGLLWSGLPVTAIALVLYGAGNGIHSIARGALPLVLFDPTKYAALMGRLAMPSLIVQALAPSLGALLLGASGTLMLSVLLGAALLNIAFVLLLAELRARERAAFSP